MEHAQQPGAEVGSAAVRVDQTGSPSSGTAIALTVKSRRARSSASVPGRTSGSAPGSG